MLGNLSGNNINEQTIKSEAEESLKRVVRNLEEHVDALNERVDNLTDEVDTVTLNVDDINAKDIDTNRLTSKVLKSNEADIGNVEIGRGDVAIRARGTLAPGHYGTEPAFVVKLDDNESSIELVAPAYENFQGRSFIKAQEFEGQLTEKQKDLSADKLNASNAEIGNLKAFSFDIENIKTETSTTKTLNVEDIGANTAQVMFGEIHNVVSDKVESEDINAETLKANTLTSSDATLDVAKVKTLNAEKINTPAIKADVVETAVDYGTKMLNLDFHLGTENDYYLLTIKKGFSTFNLSVEDSFDITLTSAWIKNADLGKNGATMALVHQKELGQVVSICDDENNVYIQIAPNNYNELFYRYSAKQDIEDIISFGVNTVWEPDYFYRPARVAEAIMLGTAQDGGSDYRMSVLGEFKAAIRINEGAEDFKDVIIANNLFVKDYYNDVEGKWIYTSGNKDDYLSRFTDEKEMVWRKPVSVDPDGNLKIHSEHIEVVTDDDGNILGERNVPGDYDSAIRAGAVADWNGTVTKDEDEPYNPIVHLGEVTEGKWNAQDITSNESMTIKHDVITWMDVDYTTTNDEDSLDWVRV